MFIKFSDKTKNIMVKKSREDVEDGYLDEESLFLDSRDEKDRRVKVLSEHEENDSKDKS
jgi:hypothetical protein